MANILKSIDKLRLTYVYFYFAHVLLCWEGIFDIVKRSGVFSNGKQFEKCGLSVLNIDLLLLCPQRLYYDGNDLK